EQIAERRVADGWTIVGAVAGGLLAGRRPDVAGEQRTAREMARRLAIALVFEELLDELVPRILFDLVVVAGDAREQHAALDERERRRHDQVLAGVVEIELADALDQREILIRNRGDRDVGDLDLVLLDQVQEQVERAFEEVELHRAGRERHASPIASRTS